MTDRPKTTLRDCIYGLAVAGALAGTAYGLKAIPQEWVDTLRGKELIERCLF